MKSFNHLWEVCISEENIKKAVHATIRGRKKNRKKLPSVKWYIEHEEETCKLAKDWIINYKNASHTPIEIYDGISRKKRTIIVPTFEELVVQHAVVQACMPLFAQGMYEHTYASIPKRGVHLAKKYIEKWIKNDIKNFQYVLKIDIRKFFDSIDHSILKAELTKYIHDSKMLNLLYTIINVVPVGLPLGFYTSQWLSNWFLKKFDHYIKEKLQANHYVRYMDDGVISAKSSMILHYFRQRISKYLESIHLTMKQNWQVFRFVYIEFKYYNHRIRRGRDLDFMGFRFFHNRVILRKSIMLKATRKAKAIGIKSKPNVKDCRQVMSYIGWLNSTNCYDMYKSRIKPYVKFQQCKRIVSYYDKEEQNVA